MKKVFLLAIATLALGQAVTGSAEIDRREIRNESDKCEDFNAGPDFCEVNLWCAWDYSHNSCVYR